MPLPAPTPVLFLGESVNPSLATDGGNKDKGC